MALRCLYTQNTATWKDAHITCNSLLSGADLVAIESEAEHEFVTNEIIKGGADFGVEIANVWTGCNDLHEAGSWVWASIDSRGWDNVAFHGDGLRNATALMVKACSIVGRTKALNRARLGFHFQRVHVAVELAFTINIECKNLNRLLPFYSVECASFVHMAIDLSRRGKRLTLAVAAHTLSGVSVFLRSLPSSPPSPTYIPDAS